MVSVLIGGEDRWELGEVIGSGGAGQVRLATCGSYEPHVIKLVPNENGALRELTITQNLDVPNVVPVLDTGRTETHLALLMPKADRSLRDHIEAAGGPLPEDEALAILCDIARALAGLVRARTADGGTGIVHRDLKPENVLYLSGAWSLADFGIARHADHATEMHTRRYSMTPHYAAPEQWRGETATAETDVYAFGVIACELLTGSRPFMGTDLRQQHLHIAVPDIANVSPRLAAIIAECLYKDPGVRPSPADLIRRLENQTKVARAIGGLHALQRANFAQIAHRGEEIGREQAAREKQERRLTLWGIAREQLEKIDNTLRSTILEHAPECEIFKPGLPGSYPGWQLKLNEASIHFGEIVQEESTRGVLPFDVIASCRVAVGCSTQPPSYAATGRRRDTYIGRSHSLWFCDAQTEGKYLWFETAFSGGGGAGNSLNYIHTDFGSLIEGISNPCAAVPAQDRAISALKPAGPHSGQYKVAWPFTPVIPGELDEFIDRWVTWFAEASQGKLPHPSVTPAPRAAGSWRT